MRAGPRVGYGKLRRAKRGVLRMTLRQTGSTVEGSSVPSLELAMPQAMHLDPWQIADPQDVGSDVGEQIDFALRCAILAPSSHNTQPWRFRIDGEVVELYADRSRALPVVDPDHRGLIMSCGAALFHLRLAFRAVGRETLVERMPSGPDGDLLARVRVGEAVPATDSDRELFGAITSRRTNRRRFRPRDLGQRLCQELHHAAAAEGAHLVLVTDDEHKRQLAALVAEGDRLQWEDRRFRSELAAWSRSNHSDRGDGIPGYGLGYGDVASLVGPLVIRTFDLGDGQAARDSALADGSPVLAVLFTEWEAPAQWLAAGEALAHVLLHAHAAGVSASYLNQPVEVPGLRLQLRELLGERGFPQILLRLGYPEQTPGPTPRRALQDVVL